MFTLRTLQWVILIIKIQNILFGLEAKLLVQQHGRVACRDMKSHILAHARLNQMVDHERGNPCSPPLRMNKQKGDVGLVVLHVRNHEAEGNNDFLIKDDNTEVWILQTLRQVNARPEKLLTHGVDRWDVIWSDIAVIERGVRFRCPVRVTSVQVGTKL